MSGRNFSLTPQLSSFIDRQVDDGRHQNASEVVREALRRYADDLEAERASLEAIDAVAERGLAAIERGDFRSIEDEADSQTLFDDLNRRADERARSRRRFG